MTNRWILLLISSRTRKDLPMLDNPLLSGLWNEQQRRRGRAISKRRKSRGVAERFVLKASADVGPETRLERFDPFPEDRNRLFWVIMRSGRVERDLHLVPLPVKASTVSGVTLSRKLMYSSVWNLVIWSVVALTGRWISMIRATSKKSKQRQETTISGLRTRRARGVPVASFYTHEDVHLVQQSIVGNQIMSHSHPMGFHWVSQAKRVVSDLGFGSKSERPGWVRSSSASFAIFSLPLRIKLQEKGCILTIVVAAIDGKKLVSVIFGGRLVMDESVRGRKGGERDSALDSLRDLLPTLRTPNFFFYVSLLLRSVIL